MSNYELLVKVATFAVSIGVAYGGLPYLIQIIKGILGTSGIFTQIIVFGVVLGWTALTYIADGTITEAQLLSGDWVEFLVILLGLIGASQWGYGENGEKIKERINFEV